MALNLRAAGFVEYPGEFSADIILIFIRAKKRLPAAQGRAIVQPTR